MIPPPITTTRAREGIVTVADATALVAPWWQLVVHRPAYRPFLSRGSVGGAYLGVMGAVTVSASGRVAAAPDRVREALLDLPAQVEWFPGCVSSTVLETDDSGRPLQAQQVNDVKVAKDEFELAYSHSDGAMSWTLIAPSMAQKSASGSWSWRSDGDGTEVTLTLTIEPAIPLPGFVAKKVLGDTAKGAVKGLGSYVES